MNARKRILEAMGRQIRTRGGIYVATAPDEATALLWANAEPLYQLCQRAAKGQPPTAEEFARLVKLIPPSDKAH